jgi:hypothetical protein
MAQSLHDQQIAETELSIEDAQALVTKGEKALKLAEDPLFKELILEGYFNGEVLRLAGMMSDPNISEELRKCVERDLHGPASLKRYMQTMVQMSLIAENSIADYEETLDELREESDGVEVFDNTGSEE